MSRSPFTNLWGTHTTKAKAHPFGSVGSMPTFKNMPHATKTQQHHGGGGILGDILGFPEHLLGDVRDTFTGLPAGLVHLVKHPIGSVEAMGKATWQDWSPLFSGAMHLSKLPFDIATGQLDTAAHDFHSGIGGYKQFGHQFYDHPLAPILDVASVFTGGAAGAGKLAKVLSEAGDVSRGTTAAAEAGRAAKAASALGLTAKAGSKIDKLGKFSQREAMPYVMPGTDKAAGSTLYKYTSHNPLTKAGQLKIKATLDKFHVREHTPAWHPAHLLGEGARYKRLEVKMMSPRNAALQWQIHQFVHAADKLSGPNKRIYEAQVLRHSYDQMQHIAHLHPANLPLPEGWRYVKDVKTINRSSTRSFEEELGGRVVTRNGRTYRVGGLGQRLTTKTMRRAKWAPGSGPTRHVYVVPLRTMEKYGLEGANSSKFIKTFVHKPVTAWKYALLGYAPRYFVNNAVGNFFMYAMSHEGAKGVRGMSDAMSQLLGEKRNIRAMVKAGSTKAEAKGHALLNPHWMERNFKDQLNNTFAAATRKGMGKLSKYSLFPVTHVVSDQLTRRAAINSFMREQPEVRALMRVDKKGFNHAADKALSGDNGRMIRERTAQHVMDVMGDYHSLNKRERGLTNIMPFYTWNRHALRFTKKLARDHPATLDALVKSGAQGHKEIHDLLGNLPSWLQNSIPGSLLGIGSDKGRKSILSTAGLNPLATPPDVLDAASALVSKGKLPVSETIGGQLNPVIAGLIEHISGTDLTTGVPVKQQHGLLADVLSGAFGTLPQKQLYDAVTKGAPKPKPKPSGKPGKPFLFEKDAKQYGLGLLGAPVKQMNEKRAEDMYRKENNIKKGRAKKKRPAYKGL